MSSSLLPVFQSNAVHDAAEILPRLLQSRVAAKDALAFCRACRVRGIAGLFLDGVPALLHRELCRSGHAMRSALARMDDADKATGTCFPFFDAVASCDMECARGIAGLARTRWNPDEEYEDDFLYSRFLMERFFLDGEAAEQDALLGRWESVLDGADDVRLNVCRALFERSAAQLDQALLQLLEGEKARWQRLRKTAALAPEVDATEGHLSIEGIAIVRLARRESLATRTDYWGAPSVTLAETVPALFGEDWQVL